MSDLSLTNDGRYKCTRCGVLLSGIAQYCISCFSDLTIPCPECMVQWGNGCYRPRTEGRQRTPVDCTHCNNERWVLREP